MFALKNSFLILPFLLVGAVSAMGQETVQKNNVPPATETKLAWPLDCTVNKDCFIKYYPDLSAGNDPINPIDYKCGSRTQSGQQGVSIVFADKQKSLEGHEVLAAAAGRVVYTNNDFEDGVENARSRRTPCGNQIRIRHLNGYETRYCHLRQGSIKVKAGDIVEASQHIATLGQSGQTDRPQLYMEVRQNGEVLDPFTSSKLTNSRACYSLQDNSMWQDTPQYLPALVLTSAIDNYLPSMQTIQTHAPQSSILNPLTESLVAWVRVQGLQKGDEEHIEIITPQGNVWKEQTRDVFLAAEDWVSYLRGMRGEAPLPEGQWQAHYTLKRQGEPIIEHTITVDVR